MLVVRIEEWHDPYGTKRDDLGVLKIQDDRSGSEDLGNYEVSLETTGKAIRTFRVEGHRRMSGIWHLALAVLQAHLRPTVTFGSPRPPIRLALERAPFDKASIGGR